MNPLTESLFYNDNFASSANPKIPVPIETEDLQDILDEDNAVLLTEGDA